MTETIEEIVHRFRSPVFGKFIITWLIINWKIPYVTLFVSEDKLGTTKLEAVNNIISDYGDCPWCYLVLIPLIGTAILVVAIPWIQNVAEMIRLHCHYLLEKYIERKKIGFELVAKQNAELIYELNKLKENTTKELKHRIANSDIPLSEIFLGRWKIEVIEKDNHLEFTRCEFRKNKFFNDSGAILCIESIRFPEDRYKNIHSFNAYTSISTSINDNWKDYSVQIESRNHIRFYKANSSDYIRLTWENAL